MYSVRKVEQVYTVLRAAAAETEDDQEEKALELVDAYFQKQELTVPDLPPPYLPMPAHAQSTSKVSNNRNQIALHAGSSYTLTLSDSHMHTHSVMLQLYF